MVKPAQDTPRTGVGALFQRIIDSGTRGYTDPNTVRALRLTNIISLGTAGAGVLWMIGALGMGTPKLLVVAISGILGNLLSYVANARRHHDFARGFYFVFTAAIIFSATSLVGKEGFAHIVYATLIGLPFLLCSWSHERGLIALGMISPLVGWIALEATGYQAFGPAEVPPETLAWPARMSMVTVLSLIALQLGYFSRATETANRALQQTAEDLKRAMGAAEAANKAKSTFLANMSHEIRTPMNAILGFAQLMRHEPELSPSQRESLTIINQSGEHLLGLINDILEMSKIEAGRSVLNPTTFDLRSMLKDLEVMFRVRTNEKGLELAFLVEDAVPRHIVADEGKLRQVLLNLLSNAVKFTHEGRVEVRVGAQDDRRLTIEVEDTGPGIVAHELDALFEVFGQTESGRQSGEGTGLGLPISREYAQLMGGDLTVTSEVGKGSTFRVDVEMEASSAANLPEGAGRAWRVTGLKSPQSELRILVVDDRATNRLLLSRLLVPVGFHVREATDGQEAVEAFQDWRPHLILMDRRMPRLDGIEATRQIKAMEGGSDTHIISVSASVLEEERQAVLDAGADGFLRKPLREEALYAELSQRLGVEFTVDEGHQTGGDVPPGSAEGLPTQNLAALPEALLAEMRQATINADLEALRAHIAQVEASDAALASALGDMADRYAYDDLLAYLAQSPEAGEPQ